MPRFSERMGLSKPILIQTKSLDQNIRNLIWNAVNAHLVAQHQNREIHSAFCNICADFLKKDIDEFRRSGAAHAISKNHILKTKNWWEVIDFIEMFIDYCFAAEQIHKSYIGLSDVQLTTSFINRCNNALSQGRAAFRIVGKVVAPITNENEIAEIEGAQSASGSFSASAEHISQALSLYSNREIPDFRNAIKEAISAVEGAAREITGKNKFSDAIDEIKRTYGLHPAQAEGLKKIYGYTSDADGIRHPLKDTDSAVTEADARFMIVICSAFMNYLISLSET